MNNIGRFICVVQTQKKFYEDKYLYCGMNGNIGQTWLEASKVFGFELAQCCADGYEMQGIDCYREISDAILGRDIICTDSLPLDVKEKFVKCQVNVEVMRHANKGAVVNPCPPFYRGEEVSEDVIASEYFVGYDF